MRLRLNEGTPIPEAELRIGMLVHLKGTDFGCVWKIVNFEREGPVLWLIVRTPMSGKTSRARASRARYIRAQEPGYRPY